MKFRNNYCKIFNSLAGLLQDVNTKAISDEKSKVNELTDFLSELEDQGGYFIDFISTSDIQAGIIRLHPGENDTQGSHSVDEVYYVIEAMVLSN
jgi:hypothetical protein